MLFCDVLCVSVRACVRACVRVCVWEGGGRARARARALVHVLHVLLRRFVNSCPNVTNKTTDLCYLLLVDGCSLACNCSVQNRSTVSRCTTSTFHFALTKYAACNMNTSGCGCWRFYAIGTISLRCCSKVFGALG